MISRRRFLTGVAIGLAPIGAAAHAQEYKAQQSGKVYRIGFLAPGSSSDMRIRRSVSGIRALSGHSTHAMTMRYAHLSPGCLRDEMAKTDRSLEPPAGTKGRNPWEPLASGAAPLVFLHQ